MIELKNIEHILSHTRKAVEEYDMIAEGDKIAVGVSGGKDSLTLLCALSGLKRFYPVHFDIVGITIDMGFENSDFTQISDFCNSLGIEYHVVSTEIYEIIFNVRKEKNPCSLCARMRRGALHDAALQYGCNKIALGHHFDDVIETFMLNLFFEGRIGCFSPVTYLSRKKITMIRPLVYTHEKEIKYFATKNSLPVYKSPCPADGNTERAKMKEYLKQFDDMHDGLYYRILGAIQRGEIDGFHTDRIDAKEKKRRNEERMKRILSEEE